MFLFNFISLLLTCKDLSKSNDLVKQFFDVKINYFDKLFQNLVVKPIRFSILPFHLYLGFVSEDSLKVVNQRGLIKWRGLGE